MSPTTVAVYPAHRSGHRDPPPPMFGTMPMPGAMSMLGSLPMLAGLPALGAAPRIPSHEEFFTGLRSILDNLEQATRPPAPVQHRWHGPGHEHGHPHGCDCGCCQGRDWGWGHARGHECDCGRRERCGCRCCVDDADLIVQARLGEQRVVPIQVANERRRERDVELQLSDFRRSGGGDAPVSGSLDPTRLHLEPCGEQSAVLTLDLPLGDKAGERQPDVDECLTAYADLRLTGCDIRPLRIAVVILPRECDAYLVECGCGCC